MRRIWAVLALGSLLTGCGGGGGADVPSDSAGSQRWSVTTTRGNTVKLEDQPGGGVAYDLPSDPAHPMGYVTRSVSRREQAGSMIEAHITVTGDGVVHPVNGDADCAGQEARLALYIQRQGDDWLASEGTTEFYRWWWNPREPMQPGAAIEWSVPLMPSPGWYSVYGKNAADYPDEFKAAVRSAARVGVTHGGCGAAGHGVYVADGSARVTIESLTIR